MYREKMLSVGKIANGYLIEVRAPYKRKEKEDEDKDRCCCVEIGMGYGEEEVFAKDPIDLGKKIEALIPMLDEEFASKSEFESAFEKLD